VRRIIPQFIIGILAEILSQWESHASLDSLFMYANAPGEPPEGSKPVKVQEWLRRVNKTENINPLEVLGRIVEKFLDDEPESELDSLDKSKKERNKKIREALKRGGLNYSGEGIISGINSSQVRSLESEIKRLNIEAIDYEFKRAIENVEINPYESVSAACNILESIFKVILEDRHIDKPKIQDISNLWKIVKKELGLEAESIEDNDLLQILSGLSSIISGTAALRTHASSAHGRGNFRYKLHTRHVLLAIHSAHTLGLFIIQTWKQKN
jgi:hypothetical protein